MRICRSSLSMTPKVALCRALQRVGCSSGLCRSLKMIFPSGEDQYRRMAFEGSRKDLCALHAQANAIILDCRKSGLGNTGALRQLILAKTLQLADDAHGFASRNGDAFSRGTKLLHLGSPVVMSVDLNHLEELLVRHRAVKDPVLQTES